MKAIASEESEVPTGVEIDIRAEDGYRLRGHYWAATADAPRGVVVINPATAVLARYYHRYARFLAVSGFAVLTYDYRGIGASRHGRLRSQRTISKLDWGRLDCEAALSWTRTAFPDLPLHVVAHSIGGLLVGLAGANRHVSRCLTVGAQYAYWRDYAPRSRLLMLLRWHCVMPALTVLFGYFPARALGWHEDLPAGAAYEWAFRPARLEEAYADATALEHFDGMRGEMLAVGLADDPFGTPAAVDRLLNYFRRAERTHVRIVPASLGERAIGHFGFFHARFRTTLWRDSVAWLEHGRVFGVAQPRPNERAIIAGARDACVDN